MIEISWEALLFIILGANSVWLHYRLYQIRMEGEATDEVHSCAIGRMIKYLRHKFPKQLDHDEFINYVAYGEDDDGDNTDGSDTS